VVSNIKVAGGFTSFVLWLTICVPANAENCNELWLQRNAIFKQAGYCFKLSRAISVFGNAGCKYDDLRDVPLSDKGRNEIDRLARSETILGCIADQSGKSATNVDLYTPAMGSSERASIMDAIRLATRWVIKFKVDHLAVARNGNKAIAVVDVSDASAQVDNSGVFELEGLNGQWRTLYSVGGGGGASDCKTERAVLDKMIAKPQEYSAPHDIFPKRFWQLSNENNESKSGDESCMISESYIEAESVR
jgi:hypothetical protein